MENKIKEIPILQKSKEIKTQQGASASCCAKPAGESVCCTPSKNAEENNGACCAQPANGAACCEK